MKSFLFGSSALMLCSPALAQVSDSDQVAADDQAGTNDIVVTATRQSERLSRVPLSIAAFDQELMDKQGVRQVDDLVQFTPGLTLSRGGTGSNQISIRGIVSSAGAGTTGVYIDNTPIQVRNLGYGSGNAFPVIFDLERVEVLRGPQGTLFGSGSQGGTVRFIQRAPEMFDVSSYGRAEVSKTEQGDWNYEAGVAFGAPIIEGKIGFRGSVFYRREGGYVDGVTADVDFARDANGVPVAPGGQLYADSIAVTNTQLTREDTNWNEALAGRLAVELRPTETLSIVPSISYQNRKENDQGNEFWLTTSDLSASKYARVVFDAGAPSASNGLVNLNVPDEDRGRDRFYLPALDVNLELAWADLISSTSYFVRDSYQNTDFTRSDFFTYLGGPFPPVGGSDGFKSVSGYENDQKNFVQEVRLQSNDPQSRLRWVAGVFYSRNEQITDQVISNNFLANYPVVRGAVTGGGPFGPGTPAFLNALGEMPANGTDIYFANDTAVDKQIAGFAQVDLEVVENLTLTAGVRVSKNSLRYDASFTGALNNLNPPSGRPCPAGATCVPGQGEFATSYPITENFKTSETSITPKFAVSYQATPDSLFYASASKGFRPAGVSAQLPPLCDADLAGIGYVDGSGKPYHPVAFGSDSVWSYEVGSKNRLFGGALAVDISAYQIDWTAIQSSVNLPTCLYRFIDNLADARSRGFDLAVQARPVDGLSLGAAVGYTKASFTRDGVTPSGRVLFPEGTPIVAGMNPWTVYLNAEYEWDRFYIRSDVAYTGKARAQGSTDPGSPLYNPLLSPNPAYTVVNARAGVELSEEVELSVFVNNLFNEAPLLGLNQSRRNDPVFTASTVRPRTVGITLSFIR
jgi:outer membrane receptor protein involved in Fe transport